jgi:acyl carrier protein
MLSNDVKATHSASEIESWLSQYLAKVLEISEQEIDHHEHFDKYGLDSALAVSLTGDLEEWLGTRINPTLLYNYTTIASLSENLATELHAQ